MSIYSLLHRMWADGKTGLLAETVKEAEVPDFQPHRSNQRNLRPGVMTRCDLVLVEQPLRM
jgi:hypothetical protein